MFKTVVGQAEGTDSLKTVQSVLDQCLGQLDGLTPNAGIIYAADRFEHSFIVAEILKIFPGVELSGCTTGGEMSSAYGFSQDSVCLTLFVSDTISITSGFASGLEQSPEQTAIDAIDSALSRLKGTPSVCLLFPGIMREGTDDLLKAAYYKLGPECRIFGGVAGTDSFSANKFRIFSKHGIEAEGLSLLLFCGPLRVESVICNSWEPVGYKSTIDETEGNKIKRIGGRTALGFYRNAFGPYTEPLPEMPLAVFDEGNGYHLRATIDFDEEDESIYTPVPIKEGSRIQLTEATPAKMLNDLESSLNKLHGRCNEWTPQTLMLFSCASRRWILGMRTGEELELAKNIFPDNLPLSGYYTFGEIASIRDGGTPKLHNCTMVALAIGEVDNNASDFPAHHHDPTCLATEEKLKLAKLKMLRAGESQKRLEIQKEAFTNVLRRTTEDLIKANRTIREHNLIMKESLTMAQEVQQSLIPNYSPIVKGFEVVGRSISCDETGGDYLDYLPEEEGLSIVVGDVAGHGVAAALVMTTARALLRMRADIGGTPSELTYDLNRLLTKDFRTSGRFMTFFYAFLNEVDRTLTWVRAGHEPGLIYSPETGEFTELMGEGIALGVLCSSEFPQYRTRPIKAGEIVLIHTDGFTEAHSPSGELYGRERLKEFIRNNATKTAPEILDACFEEIKNYQQGEPAKDDETIVIIKGK